MLKPKMKVMYLCTSILGLCDNIDDTPRQGGGEGEEAGLSDNSDQVPSSTDERGLCPDDTSDSDAVLHPTGSRSGVLHVGRHCHGSGPCPRDRDVPDRPSALSVRLSLACKCCRA